MKGERFGNYQAVELLGEGGMGEVYLAEHPGIGRRVAVKVLRGELVRDPQVLTRFLNEARAANAIRHPNIIEILDSGTNAAGVPYLVMELLEGESLRDRIARVGALGVRDALPFAYQTASAVGAAHERGIVHRDLKPDNLFIVPDPIDRARERIKVLDFGIAKLSPGMSGGEVLKTKTGTLVGTPVYMSPEQCLGTRDLDARSDIYSLGVILFEMLCGRPPFVSTGIGELIHLHLNVAPPAPRSVAPSVPEALSALVLRMLAKKPEERVGSMAEVQAALRAAAGPTLELVGMSSPSLVASAPTELGMTGERGPMKGRPHGATTLSSTAAEAAGPSAAHPVWRQARKAAAVGFVVVLGLYGWSRFRTGDTAVAPPPPAMQPSPPQASPPRAEPANRFVRVTLDSTPSGADVVTPDGVRLGTTPFVLERAPGAPLRVELRREGFLAKTAELPLERDLRLVVKLDPTPAAPKPPRARRSKPPTNADEPAKL